MKRKFTFLIAAIAAILMMAQPNKGLGQTATKTEGFEHASTNSTYNSTYTVNATGNSNYSDCGIGWSIYYGCVSTTNYISGSRSAHMRYYTSSSSNLGYAKTTTGVTGLTNVSFNARVSNTTNQMGIWYNTDGGDTWTAIATGVTFETASTSTPFSYNIPNSSLSTTYYIKIGISSASTNKAEFIIDDVVFTYATGSTPTVNTPQIVPNGGSFYPTQEVQLSCTTDGASIYYTTDGTAPSTSSTPYSSVFTINSSCTVKAIATKSGMTNSSVAEATFTKITPYANIAALTAQTATNTYYVTFNNVVVTYVNGNYAYLQDASGAVLYYKSGHGLTAGKVLNGTAQVSYKLQNNLPEIIDLSGVEISNGDAPAPTTIAQSAWSYTFANVYSQYFKIVDATITKSSNDYYVSLGGESIKLYKSGGISLTDLTKKYAITGFPMVYNTTKEIQIFSNPGVEDLTIESSALQLSYQANPSGSMTVGYSNFTPTSVTAALYSDSGCNTSFSDDWISITSPLTTPFTSLAYNVSANEGPAARTVYMKVSATNANNTTINKVFTITQDYHHTYSVTYKANGGTGDDLEVTGYDYNATVTVKANEGEGNPNFTKAGYTFQYWNTNAGGTGTQYDPADNESNTFNITANTNLFAQWQANTYDLHKAAMTNGSVSFKVGSETATTAQTGQTVTIVVTPASGYKLTPSSLTVTNDKTHESVTVSNTNTFTMPASSITVSATFEVYYALTIDFESALNTYTNWDFENITKRTNSSKALITPHAGTGYGVNVDGNGTTKTTASITTKSKIANPGKLTCYISKESNNTTSASWKIQTSTNNTTWTDRSTASGSDASMNNGTWNKFEYDLSELSNVYVRVYYDGNNAIRCIDDISLEYTPSEYAVTLSSVSGGTISASDGTTTITSGSGNFETGKTITLTAEGDATHMFSAWSVSGATVADASSATTTFEMPTNEVTVSATFVESWTFTYNINGNVVSEKYAKDNSDITLPTTSEFVPEGYVIIGWTATEGDVSSPITSAKANQNRTLYAVFGKIVYGDFVKVTSSQSDWSGFYLIVYEETSVAYDGSLNSTNLDNTPNTIDVTISSSTIEHNATTEASMFKIEKNNSYYTIRSASGYYIGRTGSTNGLDIDANTKYNHTISYSSGVTITSSGGPTLQFFKSGDNSKFRYYASTQKAVALYKASISYEGAYTHIYPSNATATGDINVSTSGPIVIESGATLDMGSYALSCNDATKLIIEDGGQLKFTSTGSKADVKATVQKNIIGYGTGISDKWNFIASPVTPSISPAAVTNLLGEQIVNNPVTYNYDLYRLNNTTWENYHQHNENADPFMLVNSKGYLYAKQANTTLSFAGTIKPYDDTYEISVSKGWNLVGNPYTFDAYASVPYYAMDEDGTGITANTVSVATAVKPCTGIVIYAENDGTIAFSDQGPVTSVNHGNLQMVLSHNVASRGNNAETIDNAIVSFNEGTKLQKFYFGEPAANIFIPQNGEDYAIAFSNRQGDMPLNFKAKELGTYTISFEGEEMDLNGIYLIDMLDEVEIDLSINPSYTFIGSPADRSARFKIVFKNNGNDSTSDIFAYQSGSDIVVSGEGELQIFDVMGRMVARQNVNGVQTINAMAHGVYIFKLNEKTQKIIVK